MTNKKDCIDPCDSDESLEIHNISDFFDNEKFKKRLYLSIDSFLESLSDMYDDKSLSSDSHEMIEKMSHYFIAKILYEKKVIDHIEEFATSKKTLKSCFRGNTSDLRLLWLSLIPVMFASIKEHFLGWNSWQDHLNNLSEDDFQNLLSDIVKFISDKNFSFGKPSQLSYKQFISEIRNALDHTRYVFWSEDLHIKNPKSDYHKYDFEVKIPYIPLLLLILDVSNFMTKNSHGIFLKCDDEIFTNPNNLEYNDFKDKFHIYQYLAKWKNVDDTIIHNRELVLSKYLIGDVWDVVGEHDWAKWDKMEDKIDVLEEWWLLTNYFAKEKFEVKRLVYIAISLQWSLIVPMSRLVYYLLIKNNSYKWLNSDELINDAYQFLSPIFLKPFSSFCSTNKGIYDDLKNYHLNERFHNPREDSEYLDEKWKILIKIMDRLVETKQSNNWQPVLKTFEWCSNFTYNYLVHCGFAYDGKVYKKWDIEFSLEEISDFCGNVTDVYFSVKEIVRCFPNRLKVQLIKMVYLNELISLEKGSKWCEMSERERIRNALAHDNYIILAWVDQILLRDGYVRSEDKWSWEKLYKLSELYESTYKAMDENLKNFEVDFNCIFKK